MQFFSSNIRYMLDELSDKLGITKRSLFRYIDTFKNAGFVVQRIDTTRSSPTSHNWCISPRRKLSWSAA